MAGAAPVTQDGSPWEDTAIAKSWDRVVSDYKIFHDVRARGGSADDLRAFLRDYAQPGPETSQDAKPETTRRTAEEVGGRRASTGRGEMAAAATTDEKEGGNAAAAVGGGGSGADKRDNDDAPGPGAGPKAPPAGTNGQAFSAAASNTNLNLPSIPGLLSPQTVLGGADDGLKKLLMSWYYAGYYTGLYEGQQQASQQQPQEPDADEGLAHGGRGGVDDVDLDLDDGQEIQQ